MESLGGWIQTYSGKAFGFPVETSMFDLLDIAQSLSNLCRYNGHCRKFYSVAEHCVLMSDWALNNLGESFAKAALVHDASEAYLTDIPKPQKILFPTLGGITQQVDSKLGDWLHVDNMHCAEIKEADWRILEDEKIELMGREPYPWVLSPAGPLGIQIKCWDPTIAKMEYLKRAVSFFPHCT